MHYPSPRHDTFHQLSPANHASGHRYPSPHSYRTRTGWRQASLQQPNHSTSPTNQPVVTPIGGQTGDHSQPPHAQTACHPNSFAFIWIPCVLVGKYVIHLDSVPPVTPSFQGIIATLRYATPYAPLRQQRGKKARHVLQHRKPVRAPARKLDQTQTVASTAERDLLGFARFPVETRSGLGWIRTRASRCCHPGTIPDGLVVGYC
jgi:hypothetical protein